MSQRKDTLDSFWDLSALSPAKKRNGTPAAVPASLPLIETSDDISHATHTEAIPPVRVSASSTVENKKTGDIWEPQDLFLKSVFVRKWSSTYNYYEDFYHDTLRFLNVKGSVAVPVSFFSYVPQYSQLTASQFKWYFFWRTQLQEHGVALSTDESYIFLYLYEIINLADNINPHLGLQRLMFLWKSYKDIYPGLNKYVSEWVVDYCLIHRLVPSLDELSFITQEMISSCTLKEFFWRFNPDDTAQFASFLMDHTSSYHYKQSKYYKDENAVIFDTHIHAALELLLSDTLLLQKINACMNVHTVKIVRDAFVGALCACMNKRKLEIEYVSISRSHEVRYLIGDAVKYAENHIRASLGIKSRLSIFSLPDSAQKVIDEYFATHLFCGKRKTTPEREAYENLYDVPEKELSIDDAKTIEQTSWDTTNKLISAIEQPIDDYNYQVEQPTAAMNNYSTAEEARDCRNCDNPLMIYKDFAFFMISGDVENALKYCRERNLLFDSVINVINESAVEIFGDVLFEDGTLIADYKTDLINYYNESTLTTKGNI